MRGRVSKEWMRNFDITHSMDDEQPSAIAMKMNESQLHARPKLVLGCHKEHIERKEGRLTALGIFVVYVFFVAIPIRATPTNSQTTAVRPFLWDLANAS